MLRDIQSKDCSCSYFATDHNSVLKQITSRCCGIFCVPEGIFNTLEKAPYFKLLQHIQTYLYLKLNGYRDNDNILRNESCYTFTDYQMHIKIGRNLDQSTLCVTLPFCQHSIGMACGHTLHHDQSPS